MTRLLSPILKGSILCAFVFGSAACSDGSGFGSRESGQGAPKPNDSTTGQLTDTSKETGDTANAQRDLAPVKKIDKEVVAFHVMKDDPSKQMIAYHYCDKLPSGMIQCVLFDGDSADAKMLGLEYIISKDKFDALDEEEKKHWHPHNYEILSGQLVAPGMSEEEELALMTELMNSYGKTYQFMIEGDDVPKGEPKLAWSINHDGELQQNLLNERDQKLGIDTEKKEEARQSLEAMAEEQEGVNALDNSRMAMGEGGDDQSSMDQPQQAQSATDEDQKPMKGQDTGDETAVPVKGQQGGSEGATAQSVKGEEPEEDATGQGGQDSSDNAAQNQDSTMAEAPSKSVK